MMAKPGVMLYFDVRPCLKRLSAEEKGLLFDAILEYGENGTNPDFDGMIGIAWDFIQLSIDRDSDRYDHQVSQKRYATYVREAKRKGVEPVSFETWNSLDDTTRHHLISGDVERYPTTTPTTASTPITTAKNKADKPPTRHKYGSYKNVLFTDEEYAKLQAEYPADYSERIERLSEYIASTGKSYKSHLATIRSWARKDGVKAGAMPSYGGEENWSL